MSFIDIYHNRIVNEKKLTLAMMLFIIFSPIVYLLITYEKHSGKTLYCVNNEYRESFKTEITNEFFSFFRHFQESDNYIQITGFDGKVYQCGGDSKVSK